MRRWIRWLVVACLAAGASQAQGQAWLVEPAQGAPRETVQLEIAFRSDGETVVGETVVHLPSGLYVVQHGTYGGTSGVCEAVATTIRIEVDATGRNAGETIPVCSVPVWVQPGFRNTVQVRIPAGTCTDHTFAARPCIAGEAQFDILGEVPPWQRSLVIVPHAAPRGPSPEALVFFDWSDAGSPSPLAGNDTPRPRHVRSSFAQQEWFEQPPPPPAVHGVMTGAPNPAVAALLRSVRATYADVTERNIAGSRLLSDARVQAVFAQPYSSTILFPAEPASGEPFALWFMTNVCGHFTPETYDDRVVRVQGDVVQVFVPQRGQSICGVPPPGTLHYLINMPPLAAGTYTLELYGYVETPDDGILETDGLTFTVAQGVFAPAAPEIVPAIGTLGLLFLVGGIVLVVLRRLA